MHLAAFNTSDIILTLTLIQESLHLISQISLIIRHREDGTTKLFLFLFLLH